MSDFESETEIGAAADSGELGRDEAARLPFLSLWFDWTHQALFSSRFPFETQDDHACFMRLRRPAISSVRLCKKRRQTDRQTDRQTVRPLFDHELQTFIWWIIVVRRPVLRPQAFALERATNIHDLEQQLREFFRLNPTSDYEPNSDSDEGEV